MLSACQFGHNAAILHVYELCSNAIAQHVIPPPDFIGMFHKYRSTCIVARGLDSENYNIF